jgi:AraC-like DNA-binding protein
MDYGIREIQHIGRRTRERVLHQQACALLSRCGIRYLGISDAAAGFRFARRAPDMAVVFACWTGAGLVRLGAGWQRCGAGQVFLAPARVGHDYRAIPGRRWGLCWVAYDAAGPEAPMADMDAVTLFSGQIEALHAAATGLLAQWAADARSPVLGTWVELVDGYARQLARRCPPRGDQRLRAMWQRVEENLAQRWALPRLAAAAMLSPEQLRHLCRRDLGRSPVAQLAHLRMQRAAALLERSAEPVKAIAGRVGYGNAFAFSAAFRRHMGIPPSALRG